MGKKSKTQEQNIYIYNNRKNVYDFCFNFIIPRSRKKILIIFFNKTIDICRQILTLISFRAKNEQPKIGTSDTNR